MTAFAGRPAPPTTLELRDGYKPIDAYGVIGDLHTSALVGLDGSIDWCCLPRFDSPSVFAGILDDGIGGAFQVAPAERHSSEQRYIPSTNVLVTSFECDSGAIVEVTDFMPAGEVGGRRFAEVHRRVRCLRRPADVCVRFIPRFDYAQSSTTVHARRHGVLATDSEDDVLALAAPADLFWHLDNGGAVATLRLNAGEQAWLVLRWDDDEVHPVAEYESEEKLRRTIAYWDQWSSRIRYRGPYKAAVERSALALKLLCYEPTGAIIAAPTTSLPTWIGGVRNWDYRFSWLRDSSFILYSLHTLGQYDEADQFMAFLKRLARKSSGAHLQIMYGIDGRRDLPEVSLDHLEGHRGSRPVRVGNGAYQQVQLDVYGEVLDTAWLWARHHEVNEGTWLTLRRLVEWVADNWRQPDSGIWEVRAEPRHYVFSKVMCWVALDRGIRIAKKFGLDARLERWVAERAAIHADVMENGWSETLGSFIQAYGVEELDASNLAIPMVRFLPRDDPRVRSTVRAIQAGLTSRDHELVYRYKNDDGIAGVEGVWSICTFWLAQALALIGELDEGERIFRHMLEHANHLGLFSEQLDPETGEFLGNFPQGFTHIALINCAHVLDRLRTRGLKSGTAP